jgi:hypothetical protein
VELLLWWALPFGQGQAKWRNGPTSNREDTRSEASDEYNSAIVAVSPGNHAVEVFERYRYYVRVDPGLASGRRDCRVIDDDETPLDRVSENPVGNGEAVHQVRVDEQQRQLPGLDARRELVHRNPVAMHCDI